MSATTNAIKTTATLLEEKSSGLDAPLVTSSEKYGTPAGVPFASTVPTAAQSVRADFRSGALDHATYAPQENEEWLVFDGSATVLGVGPKIVGLTLAKGWSTADTGRIFLENDGTSWWVRLESPGHIKILATREASAAPSPSVELVGDAAEGIADGAGSPSADGSGLLDSPVAGYQPEAPAPATGGGLGLGMVGLIAAGALAFAMVGRGRGRGARRPRRKGLR